MSNYTVALERAIDRDIRDEERLEHLANLVSGWLDQLIPDLHPLEHPRHRWQPGDLVDDLKGHLKSIRAEQMRLKGPLYVDEDY